MTENDSVQLVLDCADQVSEEEWTQSVIFYQTIDPTCVELLNKFLREFADLHILLISEQRRLYLCGSVYGSSTHLDNLARHLVLAGFDVGRGANHRVVGVLPVTGTVEDRPRQIKEFAAALQYDHVLVVDDANPGYYEAQLPFVQCVANGFDVDCYFKACRLVASMAAGIPVT